MGMDELNDEWAIFQHKTMRELQISLTSTTAEIVFILRVLS